VSDEKAKHIELIEEIFIEYENGDKKLSAWEIDFLESLQTQDKLSDKQQNILKEIGSK